MAVGRMSTPLARVRGLGPARSGTEHFWRQRLTAVANVPLVIAFVFIVVALLGRNHAAVHWRSDYADSLRLGEAVAISVLRDQKSCYNELFDGFTFTKFDGTTITV